MFTLSDRSLTMQHNERTPLFPRYSMNPNLQIFLNKKNPYRRVPTNMDKDYEEEDLHREYYSVAELPFISYFFSPRNRSFIFLIFAVFGLFLLLMFMFRGNTETQVYTKMEQSSTSVGPAARIKAQALGVPKAVVEQSIEKYISSINPVDPYPEDVNELKPHHIRVIGAMGDSLTIGSYATNFQDEARNRYPGNAFFTGNDTEVDEHLTVYKLFDIIAKKTGSKIFGGSTGIDYGPNTGFNAAIGGKKSFEMIDQAKDLVARINATKEVDIAKDWKLVSLWIGTNDVGNLGYGGVPPVPVPEYKKSIEEAIGYLKDNLPRTIVSVIAMFPPQLLQEAQSILIEGKRAKDLENQKKIDELSDGYRNAVYEIQNEKKFDSKEFTVVVQPFASEYASVYIDRLGSYNSSFYAPDLFHLSKLGHGILAKQIWRNLFEPVGQKTKKANLGDTSPEIFELDEKNSFIKTIGNSN